MRNSSSTYDKVSRRMLTDPRISRLINLVAGALRPPSGVGRIALALALGVLCHSLFAAAVLAMMAAMFFGMSESFGAVPWPWALLANAALIIQFPLVHSLLLTGRGGRVVTRLIPGPHGTTLATTTYAIIASAQLLALFALWTPSGIVWWRAEGFMFWAISTAYAASWLLLLKASFDAGAEVQSGALGWMSLMARKRPIFPDMPTEGLFRLIRQPIYVARLDTRPDGACRLLYGLLPVRSAAEGAAFCKPLWRPFRSLSRFSSLCGASIALWEVRRRRAKAKVIDQASMLTRWLSAERDNMMP